MHLRKISLIILTLIRWKEYLRYIFLLQAGHRVKLKGTIEKIYRWIINCKSNMYTHECRYIHHITRAVRNWNFAGLSAADKTPTEIRWASTYAYLIEVLNAVADFDWASTRVLRGEIINFNISQSFLIHFRMWLVNFKFFVKNICKFWENVIEKIYR